jgi:hypothetical protein
VKEKKRKKKKKKCCFTFGLMDQCECVLGTIGIIFNFKHETLVILTLLKYMYVIFLDPSNFYLFFTSNL